MKCAHCGRPITKIQAGAFDSWRHTDGRMFCLTGGTIATPDWS